MPNHAELMTLKASLEAEAQARHWLKRWFMPSGLLTVLKAYNQKSNGNALAICIAFEKTWFFQK